MCTHIASQFFRLLYAEVVVAGRHCVGDPKMQEGNSPDLTRLQTMADPWLAHSVLRELDEAGARYFALTLLEPALRMQLV